MKRVLTIAASCAAVASLGASGALAAPGNGKGNGPSGSPGNGDGGPSANSVAVQQCVAEKHAMGNKAFKALYGKRAMRTCAGKQTPRAQGTVNNAAQQCKAEQADPNFAASHGGLTFAQFYGTNPNDANAFGKCVSGKVQAAQAEQQAQVQNAAQKCRAERSDPNFAGSHGGKTFEEFYGTNRNKKNAFGKCVSSKAKAKSSQPTPVTPTA
jgi:hypothetical protein